MAEIHRLTAMLLNVSSLQDGIIPPPAQKTVIPFTGKIALCNPSAYLRCDIHMLFHE